MHSPSLTDEPASARAGSLRELLVVAVPLVISSGSISLMHVVDRIMLTWHSVDALAASTPGGMLYWTLLSFPFGVAMYVNTFVAQYDGAGRRERVVASVWQGGLIACVFGLALMFLAPAADAITALFKHAPTVQKLEAEYFAVLALGSIPALLTAVLSSFFSGRGRTVVLMVVNFLTAIVNGVLNWFLIFGYGPFPEMGIRGAAWGTVLAQVATCILYVAWMRFDRESRGYPFREQFRIDLDLIRRMFRYGVPNGVQHVVDVGAYTLLLVLIGQIGRTELAATNLAFNLNSLAFIPLFGMGTAVTALVGRRIGEDRPRLAIRTTWLAFALAAGYVGCWGAMYVVAPDLIMAPFAARSDQAEFEQLRPIVTTLLYFVTAYSFFDAMAVVFGSAIRGAGDTRFSLVYTGIVVWSAMVLPVWLILRSGGGLYACWAAILCQLFILGSGFLLRFLGGKWLEMRVIEQPATGPNVAAAVEEPGLAAVCSNVTDAEIGDTVLIPNAEEDTVGAHHSAG
jgi:MATE family multidrug resistance protein